MKLVVHELKNELAQVISSDSNSIIEGIRLHIYKHNLPEGSLFLEIRDSNDEMIFTSEAIEISSISESPFFHGQVRFYINAYIKEATEYRLVLCSTGYEFSESSYIGWCADYDFNTYPRYESTSPLKSPLDFEIWQRG